MGGLWLWLASPWARWGIRVAVVGAARGTRKIYYYSGGMGKGASSGQFPANRMDNRLMGLQLPTRRDVYHPAH